MYVGEIHITFTEEATLRLKAEDYTPEALSKRFGVEITDVTETELDEVFSYEDKDYTGRFRQRTTITVPAVDEPSTSAVTEKIREHEDVEYADPNIFGWLD